MLSASRPHTHACLIHSLSRLPPSHARSTVLPQALQGVYAIDPLDFGLQVLQTTVDVVGGGPLAAGA